MSKIKLVSNNPKPTKKSLNPIVHVNLFPGFVPKPETIAERERLVAEAKKRYKSSDTSAKED